MTTERLSPLVITAPAAAVAVVLATGWATTHADAQPASAAPAPALAPASGAADAAHPHDLQAQQLHESIKAERGDVRQLEQALEHARRRLAAEQRQGPTVITAAPPATGSWGSGSSSGSSSGSGSGSSPGSATAGGGSGGGSAGSSGGGTTPAPSTNTTTSGS